MLLPWKNRPAVSLPGAAPEGTLQTTDEEKAWSLRQRKWELHSLNGEWLAVKAPPVSAWPGRPRERDGPRSSAPPLTQGDLLRPDCGLGAVGDAEFGEDLLEVLLDRLRRDAERTGNFLVRLAGGDKI